MDTVCVSARTVDYPEGGGHQWVYLNWALGFLANGWRVIWLEGVHPKAPVEEAIHRVRVLRERLAPFGLADSLAICSRSKSGTPLDPAVVSDTLSDGDACEADLMLNMRHGTRAELLQRFKRTAFLDIDPGLLQVWMSQGKLSLPRHDLYFTIGETVGTPDARFPDCGIPWRYTPPCVSLEHWPVREPDEGAPYTTVTHWSMGEWMAEEGEVYSNDKRHRLRALSRPAVGDTRLAGVGRPPRSRRGH